MAEVTSLENGRISNFEGLVTLTLTLDGVIQHTVVHHSSASTYVSNFIEIEETFCGRTEGKGQFWVSGPSKRVVNFAGLGKRVSPAKAAEPIEMPFGADTCGCNKPRIRRGGVKIGRSHAQPRGRCGLSSEFFDHLLLLGDGRDVARLARRAVLPWSYN